MFVLYAVTIGLSATLLIFGTANGCVNDAPADYYDFIVLDAYSSDAIPVHLLTREALAVYLAKLTKHGIMAFHISNVFFDLAPVVGNLAHDAGLTALLQSDSAVSEAEQKQGKYPSIWVVVTRHAEDLLPLKKDGRWKVTPRS